MTGPVRVVNVTCWMSKPWLMHVDESEERRMADEIDDQIVYGLAGGVLRDRVETTALPRKRPCGVLRS